MPAPATARLGRLQLQGGGEATEGPNAMGSNVPTIEESGDDSGRSRWGPAVAPSMRSGESPFSGVGSALTAHDQRDERRGFICESGVHCGGCRLPCHPAIRPGPRRRRSSWSSLAESTTGHHDYGAPIMLANAPSWKVNRRIIGLVSLLQRCRQARASAGTLGSRREPTPMQTTLVLRRAMRVTSPCTHSYSFPDLT